MENQKDAFSSSGRNIRGQAQNEPASCKAKLRFSENKNPGAAATATGAENKSNRHHSQSQNITKSRRSAMSQWAKDEHKRVSRMIGYVLTLGTQDAWWGLVPVLMARLTTAERVSLAYMALKSLDTDEAVMVADAAVNGIVEGAA